MSEAVIVSCARTAIGQFGQSLKDVPVVELGGIAIKEAIKRAGIRPSRSKDGRGTRHLRGKDRYRA